jgi:hypothetical protein
MRHIDPATLHDEWYIAQTPQVRLFWLSLLLAVDDQGRFAANPALVRSQLFPADDLSLAEVEALLQAVDGKVLFYEANGNRYGQLANWWKYQSHAVWMGPSRFPPPDGWADRYRYHAKGNKIVQSSNWRDAPEVGPNETAEGEPREEAGEASAGTTVKIAAQLDSHLHSGLGSNGGRGDGDVDVNGDDDGESEGDGDTGHDEARARPRAVEPALARALSADQDPGNRVAQAILLQACGLAALPPTEGQRVEQVQAMITAYGEAKTLAGLRAEREKWCRTRGRNGSFYSLLNMGWVDWADEALSDNGPPPEPPEVRLPPPPPAVYPDTVPMPPDLPRPNIRKPNAMPK